MVVVDVFGVDQVAQRLTAAAGSIGRFKRGVMREEMNTWQTTDMHRKKPATRMSGGARQRRAFTIIRPHSRYEMLGISRHDKPTKPEVTAIKRRVRTRRRRLVKRGRNLSTRPILRASLEQLFMQRLTLAFHETISWKK